MKTEAQMIRYLSLYDIQLVILPAYLRSHACCHSLQIAQDLSDTLEIFIHFFLPITVCDPVKFSFRKIDISNVVTHFWM